MTAEPRPAEEMTSPADIGHLVEQLSVQNFRPIRSELYAALSELRDHRAEVERLSAELADARTEFNRYRAEAMDFVRHADQNEGQRARADAAERALEAVRAQADEWRGTHWANDVHERSAGFADDIDGALSAASPTTSDEEPVRPDRPRTHPKVIRERATVALDGSAGPPGYAAPAASDEPARCPHGNAAAQTYACGREPARCRGLDRQCKQTRYHEGPCFQAPGLAASGTPDGER